MKYGNVAKGGNQNIDLSSVTVGTQATISGIYDMVKGNNGKPIMIKTTDGQRVYAEVKAGTNKYVTAYLGADGATYTVEISNANKVDITKQESSSELDGRVDDIEERLDAVVFSNTYTQIQSYTSTENTFVAPTDGYFCYSLDSQDASGENTTLFKTKNGSFTGIKNVPSNGTAFRDLLFVRKGMEAYFTLQSHTIIYFMSLVN